jgi:hypothetical protein
MGHSNGKGYIDEMLIRNREDYKNNGNKLPAVRQWKDLPKKVKKKTKKKVG